MEAGQGRRLQLLLLRRGRRRGLPRRRGGLQVHGEAVPLGPQLVAHLHEPLVLRPQPRQLLQRPGQLSLLASRSRGRRRSGPRLMRRPACFARVRLRLLRHSGSCRLAASACAWRQLLRCRC